MTQSIEGARRISFAGFLRGVRRALGSSANTDERSGDISVPLAAGVKITVLFGLGSSTTKLSASRTGPSATVRGTVGAVTRSGVFRAGIFEDDGTCPSVHGGVEGTVVHTTIFTDVTLNTIIVTTVVPHGNIFVAGRDVSSEVGFIFGGGGIFGLEATPSGVGGFDVTSSGVTTFVHGVAGPSDGVLFRTTSPSPFGVFFVGAVLGGESKPERLVGLGGDEGVFFEGGNSGEVTLHTEELVGGTRIDSFLEGTCDVDEAVEVTSQVVVVSSTTKRPSDAARLEVIGGGVEDDSGDGVEVFRQGSSTLKEERTLFIIPSLRDVEVTLIVKEEFVDALSKVDFDGNSSTINFLIIGSFEGAEGVDTEISLHGEMLQDDSSRGVS